MKKILSAILCICMIFSLCACAGQSAGNTESAPGQSAAAPAPAETPAGADKASAADADGARFGDRVMIHFVKTQENTPAPDGSVILLFSYVTPKVIIEEKDEQSARINEQLCLLDEAYISGSGSEPGKNEILEDALDNFSYVKDKDADLSTSFSAARTAVCMRADGSVISFRYAKNIYTGGDPVYGCFAVNYSPESGEKLTLDALSADPDAFRKALTDGVIAAAKENSVLYGQLSEKEADPEGSIAAVVREDNWYFSAEGIAFIPDYGEIKPAELDLLVPYDALENVMDERYLPVKRSGDGSFDVLRIGEVTDGTVQVIDRLIVSDGEELYLKVDGTAYDVTISSFFFDHFAEGDARFHAKDRLWYASYMSDCALQLRTIVPNGIPDLMITYTDAHYLPHRLFISQSEDGAGVAIVDDTIEAVG
ncbi:MAG: hypothetical protein IJQ43_00060 [Oscillospiraceae bacterium]|nr:hypothetical protein [Oscillospiraceae bacterium]